LEAEADAPFERDSANGTGTGADASDAQAAARRGAYRSRGCLGTRGREAQPIDAGMLTRKPAQLFAPRRVPVPY